MSMGKQVLKFHYWEFYKTRKGTFFRSNPLSYHGGAVLENDLTKKLVADMPLQNSYGQAVSIVEHTPSGKYAFAILHPKDQKILYGGRIFVSCEPKFRREGRRIVMDRLKKANPELNIP